MLQNTGGEYGRPERGKEKPFSEKWKERRVTPFSQSDHINQQQRQQRSKITCLQRFVFVL